MSQIKKLKDQTSQMIVLFEFHSLKLSNQMELVWQYCGLTTCWNSYLSKADKLTVKSKAQFLWKMVKCFLCRRQLLWWKGP